MAKNEILAGLIKMIKYKSNLTQSEIAAQIGVSKQYLSDTLNGRYPFNNELKQKLCEQFTYIKCEGNMLIEGRNSPLTATNEEYSPPELYYTYLIPMSAMGGSLIGFDENGVRPAECERIVSPIAGVDFAISVYGDSMVPEFPSGSRVLIKRIDPTIYIDWGNIFVLDTTNGIILKEVQPSQKEGVLTCHSLNPNGRYKDFDVPMCEIRAMYKVLACVSLR